MVYGETTQAGHSPEFNPCKGSSHLLLCIQQHPYHGKNGCQPAGLTEHVVTQEGPLQPPFLKELAMRYSDTKISSCCDFGTFCRDHTETKLSPGKRPDPSCSVQEVPLTSSLYSWLPTGLPETISVYGCRLFLFSFLSTDLHNSIPLLPPPPLSIYIESPLCPNKPSYKTSTLACI